MRSDDQEPRKTEEQIHADPTGGCAAAEKAFEHGGWVQAGRMLDQDEQDCKSTQAVERGEVNGQPMGPARDGQWSAPIASSMEPESG